MGGCATLVEHRRSGLVPDGGAMSEAARPGSAEQGSQGGFVRSDDAGSRRARRVLDEHR